MTPPRVLVIGFALLILLGALLLILPIATQDGLGLSILNAVFTSTSAVCVAGLVVEDTGTTFSFFGQGVILVLIQVGGLGFMTFAAMFALILVRELLIRNA